MKAKVGRVVLYTERGYDFAAMTVAVDPADDEIAHLTVFAPAGTTQRRAPFSDKPTEGHWSVYKESK